MRPTEFIMQFAGIVNMIGDRPPTDEEWGKIREMHQEAVGWVVKEKLLERAETLAMAKQIEEEQMKRKANDIETQMQMQIERMKYEAMKRNAMLAPAATYTANTIGKVR